MFKTNSAREMFYIFLWLMGIIAFYTLIHTYFLEPSSGHTTTPHVQKETKHEIQAVATQATTTQEQTKTQIVQKETKPTVQTVPTVPTPVKVSTPVQALKAPVKEETKPVEKAPVVSAVHSPVKIISTTQETAKETTASDEKPTVIKPVQKVSTPAPVQTLVTSVPKAQAATAKKPEVKAVEAKVIQEITSPLQTLTTPVKPVTIEGATKASPSAVTQAPTVPTVPTVVTPVSVVSVAQSKPVEVEVTSVKVDKQVSAEKQIEETKPTETSTDRDATMQILENAREQIIKKAEEARAEAMRGIRR